VVFLLLSCQGVIPPVTNTPTTTPKADPSPIQPPPTTTQGTSAPSNPPETTTPAPTTSQPAIPTISKRQYRMYDRGADIVQLQMALGLGSVDGIYGPITRAAHVDALGGPVAAIYLWFPQFGAVATPSTAAPGDGHYDLPNLGKLVDRYFHPEDRAWALKVAFCESSAQPGDVGSTKVSSALAIGWFQHLAKFWIERSEKAGWEHYDPFHAEANVAVAAWLLYEGGGARHWNPSRTCWEEQ